MKSIAKKSEIDFTDEAITASGGSIFLRAMADKLGLREKVRAALGLKRLHPGGVGVTRGWREQLEEVEPLLEGRQVWLRADNAYYNRQVVEYCRQRGWDYSISVTHEKFKEPLREEVRSLSEDDWQWINDDRTEEAAIICHLPQGLTFTIRRAARCAPTRLFTPRPSWRKFCCARCSTTYCRHLLGATGYGPSSAIWCGRRPSPNFLLSPPRQLTPTPFQPAYPGMKDI